MPLRNVSPGRAHHIEVTLDFGGDLPGGKDLEQGGGELDGERHPGQRPADAGDVRALLCREHQVVAVTAGVLQKELHRRELLHPVALRVGNRDRVHLEERIPT